MRDYRAWHAAYDDPTTAQSQRLLVVQARLREALDQQPAGRIRLVSLCAGQGRDVLGVLPRHSRRADVRALLVELDPDNAATARASATAAGLEGQVDVVEGDASISDAFHRWVPADVVLACGIFGNIDDADIERTTNNISMLCRTGSTVIWTRGGGGALVERIRGWFLGAGFSEIAFDALDNSSRSGIGTCRLVVEPRRFERGFRFFTFVC